MAVNGPSEFERASRKVRHSFSEVLNEAIPRKALLAIGMELSIRVIRALSTRSF